MTRLDAMVGANAFLLSLTDPSERATVVRELWAIHVKTPTCWFPRVTFVQQVPGTWRGSLMTTPTTTLLMAETAKLEALGDLYGYQPQIGRAARNILVVTLMLLWLIATCPESCSPSDTPDRPDAIAAIE